MKQLNLSVKKSASLGEALLDEVNNRGFGSMNKNDYEVFLFNQLRENGNLKGKSNYDISLLLRMPLSKVKRLAYEASIVYGDPNDEAVCELLIDTFSNEKFQVENQKIKFLVEDRYLRSAIEDKLKQNGGIIDSSFNNEMVVIYPKDFQVMVSNFLPQKTIKSLEKECTKKLKEEKVEGYVINNYISNVTINNGNTQETTKKEVFRDFLLNCASNTVGNVLATIMMMPR